jgi:hypothetical protein
MGLIQGILERVFPPQPEPLEDIRAGDTVLVRGVVIPRDVMQAPLTDDACVYFQYTLERWRRSEVVGVGGDGFWEIQDRDEAIVEFYIEDRGTRVIVAPHKAKVERAKGVPVQDVDVGVINQRAQQMLIKPGDYVEVSAIAEAVDDLHDEGRAYRASTARLMLRAPEDREIVIRLLPRRDKTP